MDGGGAGETLPDGSLFLQRAGTSSQPPEADSDWGFPSVVFTAQERLGNGSLATGSAGGYLAVLQQSRTFLSPDCTDAMAAALGVSDLLRGLRGSLVCQAPSEDLVTAVRTRVRHRVKAGWSREAVRRGVGLAKAGELDQALACYAQALELDGHNTDAYVARGAALANAHDFQRASDDLEAALELQPGHMNAAAYLDAVRQKATEQGVRLQPRENGADGRGTSAGRLAVARESVLGNGEQLVGRRKEQPPHQQQQQQDVQQHQQQQQQQEQQLYHHPWRRQQRQDGIQDGGRVGLQYGSLGQQQQKVPIRALSAAQHYPQGSGQQQDSARRYTDPQAQQTGKDDHTLRKRSRSPAERVQRSPSPSRSNSRSNSRLATSSSSFRSHRPSSSGTEGEEGEVRRAATGHAAHDSGQPPTGLPDGAAAMDLGRALAILTKHHKHSRKDGERRAKHRHKKSSHRKEKARKSKRRKKDR